jgi:serine protein kinase
MSKLFEQFQVDYASRSSEEMSLHGYLDLCRDDPMAYAGPAERLLKAIGEPVLVETRAHPRLLRIFGSRQLRRYQAFSDFFGMEDTVEQLVAFLRHSAQGLEERKQVLYLLGPVGSAKSSLAERLKSLMEMHPIYVLKNPDTGEVSPLHESPLGLFSPLRYGDALEAEYGIPKRVLTGIASPWATKRLQEFGGDLTRFHVVRVFPSILEQRAISKTEPGDENNQDISALVGKVDIRKLDRYSQDDPDAYSYSGGLCLANQGLLEFVEMFKAPLKVLNPLLTATQESNFKGTEGFGAMPFQGIVLAHSNESEWASFRNNRTNEAFLDRVYVIKVPYCLRVNEEVEIYRKLLTHSALARRRARPARWRCWRSFLCCRA